MFLPSNMAAMQKTLYWKIHYLYRVRLLGKVESPTFDVLNSVLMIEATVEANLYGVGYMESSTMNWALRLVPI